MAPIRHRPLPELFEGFIPFTLGKTARTPGKQGDLIQWGIGNDIELCTPIIQSIRLLLNHLDFTSPDPGLVCRHNVKYLPCALDVGCCSNKYNERRQRNDLMEKVMSIVLVFPQAHLIRISPGYSISVYLISMLISTFILGLRLGDRRVYHLTST